MPGHALGAEQQHLPLPCTTSHTDWSGVREASGSVTAEYTVGTSSTTSAAYAIDNTATKKWGDMPGMDPPGWRLGRLPAGLPCREGKQPEPGREQAAGHGWGGPGPGAGETKGKRGMRETERGKTEAQGSSSAPCPAQASMSTGYASKRPSSRRTAGVGPVPGSSH